MTIIRPLAALCALALAASSAVPTMAQTDAQKTDAQKTAASKAATAKTPGAKPGDREMTCEAVAAERDEIQAALVKQGEDQAKSSRRRQGLASFAKGAIGGSLPGVLGHFSGGSYAGAIAAQAAGQGAVSAMNQPGAAQVQPNAPKPTADQQARLDRLVKIAAYRQCADA
jgi:hypothetical protein